MSATGKKNQKKILKRKRASKKCKVMDLVCEVLGFAVNFLNQNDLCALACTCRRINETIATPALYKNIELTKEPIKRSPSTFLDTSITYVSGYRSRRKSKDQNDLFLYDRVQRLLESRRLHLVQALVIDNELFYDLQAGTEVLQSLLNSLFQLDNVKCVDIKDAKLFASNYGSYLQLHNLTHLKVLGLNTLAECQSLDTATSMEIILSSMQLSKEDKITSKEVRHFLSSQMTKLHINDIKSSSLAFLDFLDSQGIKLDQLKALKLNHMHGLSEYNTVTMQLGIQSLDGVVPLERLKELELGIACEHKGCACFEHFALALSPRLESLTQLGLIEETKATQGDHYTEESWDIVVGKLLLNLPQSGSRLCTLSIRHNPPLNGIAENSVDGNYIRRRTLYEVVIPKLSNVQKLIVPCMLASLSAYDILIGDLLWNGCECAFCRLILPTLDDYIMNHQYYSVEAGEYRDISPTVFFAYTSDTLSKRFCTRSSWDIRACAIAPQDSYWDLHGYEDIQHFHDYHCTYNVELWDAIVCVVAHFFNGYMDFIVPNLPNLKLVNLCGVYYAAHCSHAAYNSIYDVTSIV